MTISEQSGLTRRQVLGRAALGIAALGLATPARADDRLFLLGLEEHFATPELQRLNNIRFPKGVPRFDINDVGAGRIADMDAAGIDLQVLSALTPGAQNLPGPAGVAYARRLNEWVAHEVIPAYPERIGRNIGRKSGNRPIPYCPVNTPLLLQAGRVVTTAA